MPSTPRFQDTSVFLLMLHQKDMKKQLSLAKSETNRTADQILVLFLLEERGLIPCCALTTLSKSLGGGIDLEHIADLGSRRG